MRKILFVTLSPIESASERYRVYQFIPYFERAGFVCTVWPFAARALHRAIQNEKLAPKLLYTPICYFRRISELTAFADYDLVVVHRGIFPFTWRSLERTLFRRHGKVIFDFDDAIYAGHQDTATTEYPWIYRFRYGPAVNDLLRESAHVMAGNDTLAEHARHFNPNVSIVPTVVDLERYTYQPLRPANGAITIGWVGSRSTSPYLLGVEPALRRLSDIHGDKIRFLFYGHSQQKLRLPNCRSLGFSLISEVADLRSIDIGIMPMPDNEWTRGKCAFKAIQYMALGIPTVASPVGMVTNLIRNGVNGFCARTTEEWISALGHLVRDAELRRRFAEEGRKTVAEGYSLQAWGPRVVSLLTNVLAESRPRDVREAAPRHELSN